MKTLGTLLIGLSFALPLWMGVSVFCCGLTMFLTFDDDEEDDETEELEEAA